MGAAIRGQQTPTEILSNETCPNPAPRDTRQHGIGTSAQVLAPSKLPGNLDPWDFFLAGAPSNPLPSSPL